MKAIIRSKGGKNLTTMEVRDIPAPKPAVGEIKVKMGSSRINPVDIDLMKGMPFLKYKTPQIGGIDGAGTIIEVGTSVKDFSVGDEVFFYRLFTDIGTWAEEITIKASDVALIPNSISVQDAGAMALPMLTAYDGLLQLNPQIGESILVHGAGGGVGFQAIQLAQRMGLRVFANGSGRDEKRLIEAGVTQFFDYKKQPFDQALAKGEVDYVFDTVGKDTLLRSIALQPKKVVSVNYIEPEKMSKTGIKMPGFIKAIMQMSMGKFRKAAKKNNVQLIGQVTGANGAMLHEAARLAEKEAYLTNPAQCITWAEIEKNGLANSRPGTVIDFS